MQNSSSNNLSKRTSSTDNNQVMSEAYDALRAMSDSPLLSPIWQALGSEALLHIVGGTVRDVLVGKPAADVDLACLLPPDKTKSLLENSGLRVVDTGLQHGTITVVVEHTNIEITTFRKPGSAEESAYSSSIEEDLEGRDFTINAIAWSLNDKKIIDPFGGVDDLRHKLLRAVVNPQARFTEDPLRILRMVRFGTARGFSVEQSTRDAAMPLIPLLKRVSVERIRSELEGILLEAFPSAGIRELADLGILKIIIPELIPSIGFEQNRYHTEDVFGHTLTVLKNCPPDLELRLCALFHDIGKPATLSVDEDGQRHFYEHEALSEKTTKTVMRRLRFSNEEIHNVASLVKYHMRPLDCGPSAVRRLMRDLDVLFEKWRVFKEADSTPTTPLEDVKAMLAQFDSMVAKERERQATINLKKLIIDGYDLMKLGYKPGKEMGKIIKEMEELVLEEPEKNNREYLLAYAAKHQLSP